MPIEVINILLAVGEVDNSHFSDSRHLEASVFNIDSADYFSLVSCLFYIKDDPRYRETRTKIETRIRKDTKEKLDVLRNAHDAHLVLDILCCPFLDAEFRTDILAGIRGSCGLPSSDRVTLRAVIEEMRLKPWFVRWESVDLLNMIRKKELSAVY